MAGKRKSSPPPPRSPSDSSDEDSSSEEEQEVVQSPPSITPTPKRTERDAGKSDSESESESESESDSGSDPPLASLNPPLEPSKSESSSSSEEDDEAEEKSEKLKSPIKESESGPDKKKPKLSGPDQSTSKKSASAFPRIWSLEDEIALLRALSEYHASKGQLPPTKDYASFLSTVSGSIGFPVTEKQLANKIRQLKHNYAQKVKKGYDKISNPHDKAVFKLSAKLFGDSSKTSKKEKGGAARGGTADGHAMRGATNGADMARSNFYLKGWIEQLNNGQQYPGWFLTFEEAIARLGESRAKDFEAKIKMLRIDALKLYAREDILKAELFGILADEMEDD